MEKSQRRARISMCKTENAGRRNWSDLPPQEMNRIIEVYESNDEKAFSREAEALGTTTKTLGRQCRTTRMIRDCYKTQLAVKAIPASPSPICNDYIIRDTENAIVISDIEIPDFDPWMLKAVLLVAKRYGIKHLILAGDIIAGDQPGINSHIVSYIKGNETPFGDTIGLMRQILTAYGLWFDTISCVLGNHDERPAKASQGQIQLRHFFMDLPVQFSEYSYEYLRFPSTGEFTYICHQYNYSKQSVKLAQEIWAVESAPDGSKRKMHVVIGHTHVAQEGVSPDDNYRCIGLGCMRDPQRTAYARHRATKFPKWNQAFLLIRNGHFYTMSKKWTDWKELLGDDYALLEEPGVDL